MLLLYTIQSTINSPLIVLYAFIEVVHITLHNSTQAFDCKAFKNSSFT